MKEAIEDLRDKDVSKEYVDAFESLLEKKLIKVEKKKDEFYWTITEEGKEYLNTVIMLRTYN